MSDGLANIPAPKKGSAMRMEERMTQSPFRRAVPQALALGIAVHGVAEMCHLPQLR